MKILLVKKTKDDTDFSLAFNKEWENVGWVGFFGLQILKVLIQTVL